MPVASTCTSELAVSTEIELILLLSKLGLHEEETKRVHELLSGKLDWNRVTALSIGAHLAPLNHATIQSTEQQIPEKVRASLTNAYNQVLVRNIRLYETFRAILATLNQAEIDCIPLKGIYLAESIYKDIGLRHLSDIDLLVKSADAAKFYNLMCADGWAVKKAEPRSEFEKEQFSPAHPYTFLKNGVTVELHTHLYNRNQRAKISEAELWENATSEDFCGGKIHQFSTEMLLQHLCLHLYKHIIGPEVKLVSFCDIRELILQRKASLNWDAFRALCETYDCLDEVNQILFISKKYWRVEIPERVFEGTLIDKNVEVKFLCFLTGESTSVSQRTEEAVTHSIEVLKSLNGFSAKFNFVIGYLFPRSGFMYQHFKLKEGTWLFPWYVVRVFTLFGKAMIALFSRISNRF